MKLSMQQVEDSYRTVVEDFDYPESDQYDEYGEELDIPQSNDEDIDDTVFRSSVSRKELRTKYLRDRGEVVGHDSSKRRKY